MMCLSAKSVAVRTNFASIIQKKDGGGKSAFTSLPLLLSKIKISQLFSKFMKAYCIYGCYIGHGKLT
jgi:hypothetical protein